MPFLKTGWHLGICSYHEIYVLITKARHEKLKFEKAHFFIEFKKSNFAPKEVISCLIHN
jgi:hypothetical protein